MVNNKGGKKMISQADFAKMPAKASLMPLLNRLEGSRSLILTSPSP
jgi:hypothetical protein